MTHTPSYAFFQRARPHYSELPIVNKDDNGFLTEFLGCQRSLKRVWGQKGIRKVYHRILELLDENGALKRALKEQKEGCKRLEQQLNEILKK